MLKGLRKYLLLAVAIAAVVGAYAASGFYGVPRLARHLAQDFVAEHYDRKLAFGEIRFNPFTFVLEVNDCALPDADGELLLGFKRLLLNADLASLWRRGASFSAIELEGPFARALIRPDGSLNLADLAKPFAAEQTGEPEAEEEPARVFIDQLRVFAGGATFEDRTLASPFRAQLRPVSFELRDFSTTGKTGNVYNLRGRSTSGESFEWDGSFSVKPLGSKGRFQINALKAQTLWSYLRESLDFELTSGLINLAGDYDFVAADTTKLQARVRSLGMSDLGIEPLEEGDFLHLKDVQVGESSFDLASRRVSIGDIHVKGGNVRAVLEKNGKVKLVEAFAGDESTTEDEPASPWTLLVPQIRIEGVKIAAEDQQFDPAVAFDLDVVDVRISGFTSTPGTAFDVELNLGFNDSGTLKGSAKLNPDRDTAAGHLSLTSIDLTAFQPYVGQVTQMTLLDGRLTTQLEFSVATDGVIEIQGDCEVAKLRTVDNALKQDFIKWDSLRALKVAYLSRPGKLSIGEIRARAPYARVIIAPDQTLNVAQILSAPPSAGGPAEAEGKAGKEAETEEDALAISIGSVRIANGSANFADFWIQPNYAVSIQGLNGTIGRLSSDPASRANLQLEGKVDRYAPAHISGEVNLLSASLYTDIAMSFQGVEMTSVTPYSGRFAGYRIEKGKLSVDLKYHIENRQLKADQRFVIDQLQLGERVESPDAVKLPLRLAVALLKDRNGVIDVPLPVSGSLDDPKFRIGPIIWKAVLGLLTKIVTAPFALLGSLFGGGEEMNQIDFEPGAVDVDAPGQEKLASLLKALKERPQLQLDVPMGFSRQLDGPVLVARELDARLLARAQEEIPARKRKAGQPDASVLADPARRFDLLVATYRGELGKDEPLPPGAAELEKVSRRKREPQAITDANTEIETTLKGEQPLSDEKLEELGKLRAQVIQDALLGSGEVDPGRVFLISAKEQPASLQKVRMEMSLK